MIMVVVKFIVLKTNNELTIVGDVYKKTATVTTKLAHNLSDGDTIDLSMYFWYSNIYQNYI